jgi:hypothetical protein
MKAIFTSEPKTLKNKEIWKVKKVANHWTLGFEISEIGGT